MPATRVLLTQTQIQLRIRELGRRIGRHYRGKRPVFLGVLNGALFFLADLVRAVPLEDIEISSIRLASYQGTRSTGKVKGLDLLPRSLQGRHVLLVDDILDTGRTAAALAERVRRLGAADVKICVLLEKQGRKEVAVEADWIGFKIPDAFVVGYGLDYKEHYRNLKQVRLWTPN